MEWQKILIPPEFTTQPPAPEAAWGAETDDGRPIQCIIWGEGSEASPLILAVRVGKLPPHEECEFFVGTGNLPRELREPTFQELRDAANNLTPEGTGFTLGAIVSGQPSPDLEGAEWIVFQLLQIGVAANTPAARRSLIITPGNGKGPHAN